jgi:phenylacetate-coenzyme A ligase PaaK-like adenylate-forming protein
MFSTIRIALKKRREIRRFATLTRDEFETYKLGKFRRLVRYVNQRSPYYRRIISERGIDPAACVPTDFPPLTKSQLMANFDEISTAASVNKRAVSDFLSRSKNPMERYPGQYRVIHTSGSSGEVGYFVYAPDDWARGWSMNTRPGFEQQRPRRKRKGRYRLAYFGATDGHYAGVSAFAAVKQNPIARLFVSVGLYEVNDPLPDIIEALNAFQPDMLVGYTTALKILAAKQREGVLKLNAVIGIVTAGEVTTANDREILSDAFGCGVTNSYACSEHLGMGMALPGSEDMVLFDDELIYEIHDDHTLVTNLFNYTVPLIRYRMADILKPLADMSRYSPYLAVHSLVGRSEIQPIFTNEDGDEDFISPHTINEIFVAGLNRFQMHLTGANEFRFLICLDSTLDDAARIDSRQKVEQRLREILDHKRMANVRFDVEIVDDLPVNPKTRKFQLIVDRQASAASQGA